MKFSKRNVLKRYISFALAFCVILCCSISANAVVPYYTSGGTCTIGTLKFWCSARVDHTETENTLYVDSIYITVNNTGSHPLDQYRFVACNSSQSQYDQKAGNMTAINPGTTTLFGAQFKKNYSKTAYTDASVLNSSSVGGGWEIYWEAGEDRKKTEKLHY